MIDHPYLEKPYGFGARKCVGAHLADAQIECFVASLVRGLYLVYCEGGKRNRKQEEKRSIIIIVLTSFPFPSSFTSPTDFQIGFREDYKFPGAHLGELKEEKGVKRGEKGERVFNMTQEMYLRADPYPDLVFTPLK